MRCYRTDQCLCYRDQFTRRRGDDERCYDGFTTTTIFRSRHYDVACRGTTVPVTFTNPRPSQDAPLQPEQRPFTKLHQTSPIFQPPVPQPTIPHQSQPPCFPGRTEAGAYSRTGTEAAGALFDAAVGGTSVVIDAASFM